MKAKYIIYWDGYDSEVNVYYGKLPVDNTLVFATYQEAKTYLVKSVQTNIYFLKQNIKKVRTMKITELIEYIDPT